MQTGSIKTGVRTLSGTTMSQEEKQKKQEANGYRFERTPLGVIVHPPCSAHAFKPGDKQ